MAISDGSNNRHINIFIVFFYVGLIMSDKDDLIKEQQMTIDWLTRKNTELERAVRLLQQDLDRADDHNSELEETVTVFLGNVYGETVH